MERKFLKGSYFPYCQLCRWDGHCVLRHYQFLGAKPGDKVDDASYRDHEYFEWHFSIFQKNTTRGTCRGRIFKTEAFYYPLQCECSTVISSLTFSAMTKAGFCHKFRPNEKGKERMRIAQKIAKERGVDISDIDPDDLPGLDPDYEAAMTY